MSRLNRYKESLNKFVRDRSCLKDINSFFPEEICDTIKEELNNTDTILSILFLTIMNNQNKKNNISLQGYYIASSILFGNIILNIMESKQIPPNIYPIVLNFFILSSGKSLAQNIEMVKNAQAINGDTAIKMCNSSFKIFYDNMNYNNILSNHTFDTTDKTCNGDLLKWYIKKHEELKDNFEDFKQAEHESYITHINKKLGSLCEMGLVIAWIIGGGSDRDIKSVKKLAKSFTMIYKLSEDFNNIDKDVKIGGNRTYNYVINYGLQDSYELFMYNKEKFIEQCMTLDIFSNTVREIVNHIEKKIDIVIDQTSPDLKSNFSSSLMTED